MSTQVASKVDISQIEKLIMHGDLSRLNAEQRMSYYRYRCESLGLDPMSRPFDYLELKGKLVLYPNRGGIEQLAKNNKVSLTVTDKNTLNDVFTVYVKAVAHDGRIVEDCGAVTISGLKGELLANAMMKAMTKAKRRATISICGLGMSDETEIETIPGAKTMRAPELVMRERPPETIAKIAPDITKDIAKIIPEGNAIIQHMAAKYDADIAGDVVIPHGSMKGKKLRDFSHDEWRSYIVRVQEALQHTDMPEENREEAIAVIDLIEGYIGHQ
jgi:hypothetical protein